MGRGIGRPAWHYAGVSPSHPRKARSGTPNLSLVRSAPRQGSDRIDDLVTAHDPGSAIRALPGEELYYLVRDLGSSEAMSLLAHATAEQIQVVLDFAIWESDRIAPGKADEWLAVLVEAPPAALGRWAHGIDVELLALLVRQRATIFDLSLDEEPEEPQGVLWHSPDRLFAIDVLGNPGRARVTQRLLEGLYRYSPATIPRLLVGMRSESDAELEETALRWRSGRMADLGFADRFESLQVYQELDPASVRIGAHLNPRLRPTHGYDHSARHHHNARGRRGGQGDSVVSGSEDDDPRLFAIAIMADRGSGQTPFARAVRSLGQSDDSAELRFALATLCNRVLSADGVAPGDEQVVRQALARVWATLDLAVEFLARGDEEREGAAIRTIPLVTLHRLGVSLVGRVRRLALALRRSNPYAALSPDLDIFTAEDGNVLQSLARGRPAFPRVLESPPAAGERPFGSLADLAIASQALERAAAAVELLRALGVEAGQLTPAALADMARAAWPASHRAALDPAAIDTDVLARTVLVARLQNPSATSLTALTKDAIAHFKVNFNKDAQSMAIASDMARSILRAARPAGGLAGASLEVAERWVRSLCPLGPVLGAQHVG